MLQKNVKIGEIYLTKIGGELRRVQVEKVSSLSVPGGPKRFVLRELRSKKLLPKTRTAAALREIAPAVPQAVHCKWCRQGFPISGDRGTGSNDPALDSAQRWRDRHEISCKDNPVRADVKVTNQGTLHTFEIYTADALAWVHENVQSESHNWIGRHTLAVEHRYSQLLAEGLLEAGFIVR